MNRSLTILKEKNLELTAIYLLRKYGKLLVSKTKDKKKSGKFLKEIKKISVQLLGYK